MSFLGDKLEGEVLAEVGVADGLVVKEVACGSAGKDFAGGDEVVTAGEGEDFAGIVIGDEDGDPFFFEHEDDFF